MVLKSFVMDELYTLKLNIERLLIEQRDQAKWLEENSSKYMEKKLQQKMLP